jgi:hypothetical protein
VPQLRLVPGGLAASSSEHEHVRWEQVRNARARISAGYYDRPEIRDRVLTAVLDDMDE